MSDSRGKESWRKFQRPLTHQLLRRIVPPVTKKLRIWLTPILITFGLAIVGFIVSAYMINGEEICLDRRPWWGPLESGYDNSCSGHIYERMHPRSP